jgi:hypothetical protein
MTVEELIRELETFDPDAEVKFTYPSHNHSQDEIACSPYSVEEGNVKFSNYCQAYIVMTDEYEERYIEGTDEEENIIRNVCLIM